MNLKDLEIFLRTAAAGSLSQAARELDITPAVASAAIKRLENHLNSHLFVRSTRSLRLTPEGEVFRNYCEDGLKMLNEGKSHLTLQQGQVTGDVRISATVDLGKQWVVPIIEQFQAIHKEVRFTVLLTDSVSDFYRDNVDLAIRCGPLEDSSLVAIRLFDNYRVICASPNYFAKNPPPQYPEDLKQHNCLTMFVNSMVYDSWIFNQDKERIEIQVRGNLSTNDSAAVRQWAIDGKGIAYKSFVDIREDIKAGRLSTALDDYTGQSLPISLLYPQREFLRPVIRSLIDFFKEQAQRIHLI